MGIKYNNEMLAELCSKLDLLEYASRQYDFKLMSGKYYCSCPKHSDSTPSLMINPEDNRFYCFSCRVRGSVLDWFTKIENMSFNDAVNKLARLTGSEVRNLKQCETLSFFKDAKKLIENSVPKKIDREILPSDYLNIFSDEIPQEWIEEGISERAIKEYEIMIDKKANRIVYPVYDADLNLIGAKGRTRFEQYKELGIAKYMNYKKLTVADFFIGWKQNQHFIADTKSVIIFEGIKSCMKASDYGYHNTLAAETSCLNEEQIKLLIKLGIKDITIAFDSDVKVDKILSCTKKLKRFTNVYYIKDKHGLLGEKESPVDRGKDIWEQLYKERMKI